MGSQKKHHGGGIPGSLSGGIAHNSGEVTKTTFSVSTAAWPHVLLSLCLSVPPSPSQRGAAPCWSRVAVREQRDKERIRAQHAFVCVV